MLAFRSQNHQGNATDPSDLDATEGLITELYTYAVDQLGSDTAPTRFGGLCALERLAQDNPAQRQTIVNVICAYLRMQFPPTAPASKPEPDAADDQSEPLTESGTGTAGIGSTWQQERQVRLTAQRILAEHLRDDWAKDQQSTDPSGSRFWKNIRLDLSGATLIDFNLADGTMADANFYGAVFSGDATFGGADFRGSARFGGATFSGDASFAGATFRRAARFGGATFGGAARFDRAIFRDAASFPEAAFRGGALFGRTTFSRGAGFGEATFSSDAEFGEVIFGGDAWFDKVTFSRDASFGEAAFTGDAGFGGATFSGGAWFGEATFRGGADALHFKQARVLSAGASHVWPTGWRLAGADGGGYTLVRAKHDGGG